MYIHDDAITRYLYEGNSNHINNVYWIYTRIDKP